MKSLIPQRLKNIYHLFQAMLANLIYGFPSRKIKIIGVTGTNGKTTTVQMIMKVLEEAGHRVAMVSTINFKLGEKEWVNKTKFTTLSSFAVQKFIRQAVGEKCDFMVLETSSHSLDQHRVNGVNYDTAVITNVTREHLDYHETMENYRLAKLRLFQKVRSAVVNLDMENPEDYLDCECKEKYGYTAKDGSGTDIQGLKIIEARNIRLGINGSEFSVKDTDFRINLPGRFNIENSLAAICVGLSQNISLETIKKALGKMQGIPGRMEKVSNVRGLEIIIDYAVTPDSLEKLYELIENIKRSDSRIISVFGSCGERDRGKRPMMGEIVDRHADYIILTNEDPYNEDPWQIIDEVAAGVKRKKEGENFWKIMDRREAIRTALFLAKAGDIIVVTGKGAEETMAVRKERIPWNDKKVILEELEKASPA